MIPLGVFVCVGGTYGVVVQIKEAYGDGRIGKLYLMFDGRMDGVRLLLTCVQVLRSLARTTLVPLLRNHIIREDEASNRLPIEYIYIDNAHDFDETIEPPPGQ